MRFDSLRLNKVREMMKANGGACGLLRFADGIPFVALALISVVSNVHEVGSITVKISSKVYLQRRINLHPTPEPLTCC